MEAYFATGSVDVLEPSAAQKPAVSTQAVATLPATAGQRWNIAAIDWSYSAGTITTQKITVAWGSFTRVYYLASAGPGILQKQVNLRFPVNTEVTVTLDALTGSYGSIYPDAFLSQ